MSLRVPSWALWVLAATLAAAVAAGLTLETRPWADDHPYLINALSALTGFAASGLFAALVLDRARRARYSDVELDRRTHALTDIDAFLRSLVSTFDSSAYGPDPAAALAHKAGDVARSSLADDEALCAALADALGGSQRPLLSPDGYPDGQKLAERFGFLADPRVEYLAERLDRKTRALRMALASIAASAPGGRSAAEAYEYAAEAAAASVELRAWLYEAPSKTMRRAVEQRAYRSAASD